MKRILKTVLVSACIALCSVAAVAGPRQIPPYGTLRTYYDHPTGNVVGQFWSCGEFSTSWGLSSGYSYYDQSTQCP